MDKVLCRNNLGKVGKWGGIGFFVGIVITALMFGGNFPLRAYISDAVSTSSYQPKEFKLDLNPVSNINDITAPVSNLINNTLNGLKFNQVVSPNPIKSPSQNIDFSKFFSSSKVSTNDVASFLKEAAITGISLAIEIISITSQILKGLLSVLK